MTTITTPERIHGEKQADAIRGRMCDGNASVADVARAFGVVFGGSIALDVAAGAAAAATARAVVRGERPSGWAIAGIAATALYTGAVRRWMLNWGATPDESRRPLPGDEMVPNAGSQSTRAITIDAPVEQVWPWLAQIGQDRGGFYSYEWLENLAGCRMRNADRVHPEWQHREIGETVALHPLHGQRVARFERNRMLSLEGWGAWLLEPLPGERTRLIARGRKARGLDAVFDALLMEIPHSVMERSMLLGIKRRAERRVR